jgi:hypothetical protein
VVYIHIQTRHGRPQIIITGGKQSSIDGKIHDIGCKCDGFYVVKNWHFGKIVHIVGGHIVFAIGRGNGNQVVLVKAAAYEKNSWFKYCCLWGPAFKNMHVLSPIECITPTGRAQGLGPAIKLFNQMIRSAQTLNMS